MAMPRAGGEPVDLRRNIECRALREGVAEEERRHGPWILVLGLSWPAEMCKFEPSFTLFRSDLYQLYLLD